MLKTIMIAIVFAVMTITPYQGIAEAGDVTRVAQDLDASDIIDLVETFTDNGDDDDYDDYDRCYRLKARALRTDSEYWWRQYRRCRYDD